MKIFADRWAMSQYRHLRLEENFWRWLRQAQSDFDSLSRPDVNFIAEQVKQKFSVRMDALDLGKQLGLTLAAATTMEKPNIIIHREPPKPWSWSHK